MIAEGLTVLQVAWGLIFAGLCGLVAWWCLR